MPALAPPPTASGPPPSVHGYTVLILEIAESSLGFDRITKKRLYARNGIRENWMLDLNARALEVYRDPQGDDFLSKQTIGRDGGLASLAGPDRPVAIADLLP